MAQTYWDLLDRQVLGAIRLTLTKILDPNSQYFKGEDYKRYDESAIKYVEKLFASNKVYLMRMLFNLKMVEGVSMVDHINEFNVIMAQMSSVEITYEDEIKMLGMWSLNNLRFKKISIEAEEKA